MYLVNRVLHTGLSLCHSLNINIDHFKSFAFFKLYLKHLDLYNIYIFVNLHKNFDFCKL